MKPDSLLCRLDHLKFNNYEKEDFFKEARSEEFPNT